jgi:hypothetical protein
MNWSRSTVWYTTGDAVSAAPIETSAAIAMTFTSPPPTRNVVTVAAPVAQPGHIVARIAIATMTPPHGFHSRWKPDRAVSPVASV